MKAERGFVGLRHPPLPDSLKPFAGAMISFTSGRELALSHLQSSERDIVLLDSLTHRDFAGKAQWIVLDAFSVQRVREPQLLALATCGKGEPWQADQNIVAIVTADTTREYWTDVRRAWRVSESRFLEISPTGVVCINEGWGV